MFESRRTSSRISLSVSLSESWMETLDVSTTVLQRLASVAVTGLLCWWSPGVVGVVAEAVEAECLPVNNAHTVNFSCWLTEL